MSSTNRQSSYAVEARGGRVRPRSVMPVPYVEANGVRLEYVEQGRGEPVVLVHGSLNDLRGWHLQVEAFAQRYRVFAYSRRCHYPNPWTDYPPDYSLATEREDLAALLRTLNLASVRLVGSSYGAYTAALVARDYPELVRSLVLGEPPILALLAANSATAALYAEFQRHLVERVQPLLQANKLEEGVRAMADGVIGQSAFDQMPPPVREAMLQNARTLAPEVASTPQRDPFTCDDARRIRVPTLLARGERSPAFFHRISDELARCLPDSETITIPAASHGMHMQNPPAYNEAVLRFFARH